MKNSTIQLIVLGIVIIILFACIWFEESELRNVKSELAIAQETIETLQTDNANLSEELDAQKARADELQAKIDEQETNQSAYIYHYNYHDSDYDDMSAKDYIAQRESGQDYSAQNGQYYGKYQLQIDMLGGDLSPENQEETAERYVMERYGSWENAKDFWDTHGWY